MSGGQVSAWRHILAAEELDLIHLLDHRALERAINLLLRFDDFHIAVNVSAGTVGDEKHQIDYLKVLRAYPTVLPRLTLELTETMAIHQPSLVEEFAVKIRALGCSLSIDDFGVGHTSFQNLMQIKAKQLKLDGSLIRGIRRSREKQNFIRLMVDFAQSFSMQTVAEHIETREQAELLSSLGVDYLQGYFLGRPVPEHEFIRNRQSTVSL